MKTTKKANKKTNNKVGEQSLLMGIILLLAFVCLAAFAWFTWQYQQSNQRVNLMHQTVDKQINLTNGFSLRYLQTLQGNTEQAVELKRDIAAFDKDLSSEVNGSNGMLAPNQKQKKLLNHINGNWQTIKTYLNDATAAIDAVVGVRKYANEMSVLSSDIKLVATRVKNALDPFQVSDKLEKNLNSLVFKADTIDALIQKILAGGDEAKGAASALGGNIQAFLKIADDANGELAKKGTIIFNTPKGAAEAKTLDEKMNAYKAGVADLTALIPQFLKAGNSTLDIDSQIAPITGSLRELKETYGSDNQVINVLGVSVGYLFFLIGLLTIGLLLLALWAYLQIRQSHRLHQEATKLRLAAEQRTENDQAAILRLMDDLAELSEGDLTIEAQVTEDFTGAIADSINFTVENMRDMVGTIMHTSDEITRATENSQNVSRLLAESSEEQSAQIDKSNKTVGSMAVSLRDVAENTDSSADIARSSVDIAHEGRERVRSTIKSMTDIRENIQDTAKRIKRLGESSQEIGDIVEIIKGIADQTNVLALNAAIQATSAGEAGRGFAVVADEVQRLAERSANATKRIEVLVKTIQADANEAVASMENSTKQVVTGAGIAEEAGHSLDQIENVSQSLANLIVNVSKATRNAAAMARDVADNMDNLSGLNQKTVHDVTISVQSVDNLRALSTSLKETVSGFKLPK